MLLHARTYTYVHACMHAQKHKHTVCHITAAELSQLPWLRAVESELVPVAQHELLSLGHAGGVQPRPVAALVAEDGSLDAIHHRAIDEAVDLAHLL